MKHPLTHLARLFAVLIAVIGSLGCAATSLLAAPPLLYADGRLTTGNTFSAAQTQNSKLVGELFSDLMLLETPNQDILGQMEGPEGSGRPICVKTELNKGRGDTVHFSTTARPGGRGAIGEALLEAELLRHGSYNVKIDQLRHGLAWTEKMEWGLAAGKSLEEVYADAGSEWFGLRRQSDMMMLWRRYATASNTIRPNSRATNDTLLSTDVMSTTMIENTASLLKSRLAKPARVLRTKVDRYTADVKSYIILAPDRLLSPIKSSSSAYQEALRSAGVRGSENVIWKGGYAPWDGQHVFHVDVGLEDTEGPLGMPIQPEALLGTALTNAAVTDASTISITGGGISTPSSAHYPYDWFPGVPYALLGHAAPATDSGVYYVVIYNVTGADAGKFGIYKYTGSSNSGQAIVPSQFLGATASGDRVTTLAGIAWDATKHTANHPNGSRVVLVNAKCVPYCWGMGLGAMAGLRPYGGPPIKPIRESADWGEKKGMGFKAIYGQGLAKDTRDEVRNYALIVAAYRPQGLDNLPVVTS